MLAVAATKEARDRGRLETDSVDAGAAGPADRGLPVLRQMWKLQRTSLQM